MNNRILFISFFLLISTISVASADRLPQEVPENQVFTIDTFLNATGIISEESKVDWTIDYQYLLEYDYDLRDWVYDEGFIHDDKLKETESIAILNWQDALRSSGGSISLSKKYEHDSQNAWGYYHNLKTEKVLTYNSQEGSHLTGSETWNLDVAGNFDSTDDDIRCVFADGETEFFPAFCNIVKAKSDLVNINSGQISAKGAARAVDYDASYPAALNYYIAVTPDSSVGNYAEGTIKTIFGGSIMEAREDSDYVSVTNEWKDSASVTGGITGLQKKLLYESGFTL